MFRILTIFLIVFLFFSIPCISICNYEDYIWTIPDATSTSSNIVTTNTSDTPNENTLNLESGSGILIEQNSGKVLYEYNSHEQLRPASVTKIMTILLIMEALDSRKNKFNR